MTEKKSHHQHQAKESPSSSEETQNVEGSTSETSSAPKQITVNVAEWDKMKQELNDYKDKYLRLLAESENARKRLYKEKQELTQYAIQNIIVDFLNPIDHLENALSFTENMSPEIKNWAYGFQMILGQFKDVLASNGVHPFKSLGTHFDPHCQEAIETVATDDHPPGIVVEENLQGYKMGDRVIRAARVKVSKASQAKDSCACDTHSVEENKE